MKNKLLPHSSFKNYLVTKKENKSENFILLLLKYKT